MEKRDYTLRIGIFIFLSLGAFFLLIYLLGLGDITELRFANIAIIILFTNRLAKINALTGKGTGYLSSLASLFLANILAVFMSIVAFAAFVTYIAPSYMEELAGGLFLGNADSLVQVCLGLFLEGMAGSAVVSFAVMQYWKNARVNSMS